MRGGWFLNQPPTPQVTQRAAKMMHAALWFLTADPAMLVVIVAALVLLYRLRPGVWTAPESRFLPLYGVCLDEVRVVV